MAPYPGQVTSGKTTLTSKDLLLRANDFSFFLCIYISYSWVALFFSPMSAAENLEFSFLAWQELIV